MNRREPPSRRFSLVRQALRVNERDIAHEVAQYGKELPMVMEKGHPQRSHPNSSV
jgi:hypothetical protein